MERGKTTPRGCFGAIIGFMRVNAAAFMRSDGQSRLKAGCGQDWPPSKVALNTAPAAL
jgi:hypothetical protein